MYLASVRKLITDRIVCILQLLRTIFCFESKLSNFDDVLLSFDVSFHSILANVINYFVTSTAEQLPIINKEFILPKLCNAYSSRNTPA